MLAQAMSPQGKIRPVSPVANLAHRHAYVAWAETQRQRDAHLGLPAHWVEHPGAFREFWTAHGRTWHAVELDAGQPIPELEDFELMVSMGGPMDVWQETKHPWLVAEKAAIRR